MKMKINNKISQAGFLCEHEMKINAGRYCLPITSFTPTQNYGIINL
jgi:hypothetical protein